MSFFFLRSPLHYGCAKWGPPLGKTLFSVIQTTLWNFCGLTLKCINFSSITLWLGLVWAVHTTCSTVIPGVHNALLIIHKLQYFTLGIIIGCCSNWFWLSVYYPTSCAIDLSLSVYNCHDNHFYLLCDCLLSKPWIQIILCMM